MKPLNDFDNLRYKKINLMQRNYFDIYQHDLNDMYSFKGTTLADLLYFKDVSTYSNLIMDAFHSAGSRIRELEVNKKRIVGVTKAELYTPVIVFYNKTSLGYTWLWVGKVARKRPIKELIDIEMSSIPNLKRLNPYSHVIYLPDVRMYNSGHCKSGLIPYLIMQYVLV